VPVIFKIDQFKVSINADDHAPPHVHVHFRNLEVVVDIRTLTIMHPTKIGGGDLTAIMKALADRQDILLKAWEAFHG